MHFMHFFKALSKSILRLFQHLTLVVNGKKKKENEGAI